MGRWRWLTHLDASDWFQKRRDPNDRGLVDLRRLSDLLVQHFIALYCLTDRPRRCRQNNRQVDVVGSGSSTWQENANLADLEAIVGAAEPPGEGCLPRDFRGPDLWSRCCPPACASYSAVQLLIIWDAITTFESLFFGPAHDLMTGRLGAEELHLLKSNSSLASTEQAMSGSF